MSTPNRKFAVIENNVVTNIIVGVEDEVVAANPIKYVEYTNGWVCPEGVDDSAFFPKPEITAPTA
jgi:predicted peptidase